MASDQGTDLSCVDDCTEDFRTVSGRMAHLQALARRWTTPRGTLIGSPNYGTDLTDYLNDDTNQAELSSIAGFAEAEALKDDRTLSCNVTVDLTPAGALTISGIITDADGPFQFTIADLANVNIAALELTA